MRGPYFLLFVFLPLVAAALIKVHKQCEMCSLMSKCLCKKASVLGKLAMSAKTVSKGSLMHLRANNQAILTRLVCVLILIFIVPSLSVLCFPWKLWLALAPDRQAESFQLYFALWKSDTVINEDLRLPPLLCSLGCPRKWESTKVPGGVYGAGWLTKRSARPAAERGGAERSSAVEDNGGPSLSRAVAGHAGFETERKTFSARQRVENGSMIWHFELLFHANSGSDSDKWSTYGSLVTVILNNDSSNREINHHYSTDTK